MISAILFEQLEWLLSHDSLCASRSCNECGRLAAVQAILLTPFRDENVIVARSKRSDD